MKATAEILQYVVSVFTSMPNSSVGSAAEIVIAIYSLILLLNLFALVLESGAYHRSLTSTRPISVGEEQDGTTVSD